jgi:hypothetical protein
MNRSRSLLLLFSVVAMLLVFAAGVPAALAPVLQTDREIVWDSAWETAWDIAWESPAEFTVEFSGDLQGHEPLDVVIEFAESRTSAPLELTWGVSLETRSAIFEEPGADLVASFGMPFAEERSASAALQVGKLYVETTPADARVSLLNTEKSFRQGLDLAAGQYIIEVERNGYESQVRRVEIIPGMAATVRMDLVQVAEVGNPVGRQPGYAPPAAESATADQLAKNLATPDYPMVVGSSVAAQSAQSETGSSPAVVGHLEFGAGQLLAAATPVPEPETQSVPVAGEESMGVLRVTSEPADARIRVLDIKPTFAQGMKLQPGTYTVDASLYGHRSMQQEVEIKPGLAAHVHFTLPEAPTGALYVRTNIPEAAIRILDIRPKFQQGMELAEGVYTIDATYPGFETVVMKVEVLADQENEVVVELDKAKPLGRLFVNTDPADANIRVLDIRPKFQQGMELPEGTYTIDATAEGRDTVVKQVMVVAGEDNVYDMSIPLEAEPGKLFVETTPSGATIRILDIKPVFQQGMELQPGKYTIDASIEGYETVVENVVVEPGAVATLKLDLQPLAADSGTQEATPAMTGTLEHAPAMIGMPEPLPVANVVDSDPLLPLVEDMSFSHETSHDNIKAFDIEVFLAMARLALNVGDYVGAIEAGAQVLGLDPDNEQAFQIQLQAYSSLQQFNAALDIVDKALAQSPDSRFLREQRQKVLDEINSRKAREEQTSEAITYDSGYYSVYSN